MRKAHAALLMLNQHLEIAKVTHVLIGVALLISIAPYYQWSRGKRIGRNSSSRDVKPTKNTDVFPQERLK